VRQELVFDLADPADPKQLPSIPTGAGTGHRGDTLSGDGKWVLVANNVDGSVTKIEAATGAVSSTIKTKEKPLTLATFGSAEGPSHQTGPIE
jgi:YVTN family beta-propeller protein